MQNKSHPTITRDGPYLNVSRILVMIVIPGLFGLPAMFFPVPPLMVFLPAMLPLGIQVAAATVSLRAVITMIPDRSVQVRLRLFDGMLAPRSIISVSQRRRCHKPHKGRSYYCRHGGFSNS
jgi:hypothetical protein